MKLITNLTNLEMIDDSENIVELEKEVKKEKIAIQNKL